LLAFISKRMHYPQCNFIGLCDIDLIIEKQDILVNTSNRGPFCLDYVEIYVA